MNSLKEVGERIRSRRLKLNMSQADLADKISVSESYMSDIERGKANVGLKIFMAITEALDISADKLLQTNVPETKVYLGSKLEQLFEGCTADEEQAILKMATEMKVALIANRTHND